jgi:hypothetical protein
MTGGQPLLAAKLPFPILNLRKRLQPLARSLVGPPTKGRSAMPITSADDWKPYARGYHAVYREHEVNHCPGCGRTHWIIGRVSAECAFCATALPLAEASMRSHSGPVIIQHKNRDAHAWAA